MVGWSRLAGRRPAPWAIREKKRPPQREPPDGSWECSSDPRLAQSSRAPGPRQQRHAEPWAEAQLGAMAQVKAKRSEDEQTIERLEAKVRA